MGIGHDIKKCPTRQNLADFVSEGKYMRLVLKNISSIARIKSYDHAYVHGKPMMLGKRTNQDPQIGEEKRPKRQKIL